MKHNLVRRTTQACLQQELTSSYLVSRPVSPLQCLTPQPDIMFDTGNITPGILRPEEQHNRGGRCDHYDNRYHNIIDTDFVGSSKWKLSDDDKHDLQSAITLVGSSVPDVLFDKYQHQVKEHRDSISSASSYSSQASDIENRAPTNQLIRYYTTRGRHESGDDIFTRRTSRFSTEQNPWQDDEQALVAPNPFRNVSMDEDRNGSLPPPYPNSRNGSAQPDCCRPNKKRSPGLQATRANVVEKHAYMLKLCKAFLLFGTQSHRLDEYLHLTAARLGIMAEFQYVPHCMFMILTDPYREQSQIHLLKESTSVDLGRLEDVYQVYHAVVEGEQDLSLSIRQLDIIRRRSNYYTNLLLILLHGLAALCAGTFAFAARPIDFGALYFFGCLLAILQLLVLQTPIRNSHILEILTCVIVAFSARALGSINASDGKPYLCFSGITQGVVALILPGHVILAATHEIQNCQVLSGSVKMIYAIIYTLFLGFGILIGTALFGFLDSNAVNSTTCQMPWYWDTITERWRATYAQFVWVPIFALAISIIHQAKPRHLPAMVFVATCGHQSFYWSLSRFAQNLQFAGMIAAFASGLLANLYAQFANCLAASILLPAVLVHIPNALAASGSLVAGVDTADAIVTNHTYWIDDELMAPGKRDEGLLRVRDFTAKGPNGSMGLIITSGIGMAQATIGITVGLFLAAFVMYPFSRRKSRLAF